MQIIYIVRLITIICMYLAVLLFFCALLFSNYHSFSSNRSVVTFGLIVVNALFLLFFLFRRKAKAVAHSPIAWLLGFGCAILPLLLRPEDTAPANPLADIGKPVQLLGAGLTIAALLSLRRSFGIVAAHRGIQTGGLYRWVRHPMYTAEWLLLLGFTLAHASAWNAFICGLAVLFQVLRARLEERLLLADPVYQAYWQRCPRRFLPGIW